MNLTEALNVALPELPARKLRTGYPRKHPKLVGREHVEDGIPTVLAVISGKTWLYQLSPQEWDLVQLFDGERSYQEIADLFSQQTGMPYAEEDIRKFAENMDRMEFWYRTPLEENVTLFHKMQEHRQQHAKKKWKFGDVAHMQFSAWDPDRYFDQLLPKLRWLYSGWFTALTIAAFLFMFWVFAANWGQIWRDTVRLYNFANKSFYDVAEFWILVCFLLFFHETAHGLTCKYYGGHVHRMGFHLIYMTPAFFTDVTEAWVYGSRRERLVVVVSGVWCEMVFCAIATPIWWGTPPGTLAHEFAYKIMIITGIGVVFFNWNPLIKLDGYFILTEALGLAELKEKSTAYISQWVKKYIWRLPVEVDYVPVRRRPFFVAYAILSGAYSYMLLFVFTKLIANIFRNFTTEWAFLPSVAVGLLLFRSRILNLWRFMNTLYLDKKDRIAAWMTPGRRMALAAAGLVVFFAPLWRDSVKARFILEPVDRAVIRAGVGGRVTEVMAQEGAEVGAGSQLVRLENLVLESDAARAQADLRVATARASAAQLQYAVFGPAEQERQRLLERSRTLAEQVSRLRVNSPIAGVVVTPRPKDQLGMFAEPGTELAEVADLRAMRARIYVPEHAIRWTRVGADVTLLLDASAGKRDGTVVAVGPASTDIDPGLVTKSEYEGMPMPNFYATTIIVRNDDRTLRPGMAGTARIFAARRSLAGLMFQDLRDFVQRKLW